MIRQTTTGIGRPHLPNFADIQRRRAELLDFLRQSQPERPTQPPEPAPQATPTPAVNPNLGEAALEKLVTLEALTLHSQPTGGRPSTHWSAIQEIEREQNEEPLTEEEEPVEGVLGDF